MEPGGGSWISGPVSLRRLISYAALALILVGLIWIVARAWGPPSSSGSPSARFDMPVEGAAAPKAGNVDYARLDERLGRLMAKPGLVGLAIAVVEDGEIRFIKGYGVTAARSNDPVTVNTVFRWASLSKGIAGDMIALLADENRLSLFEPVNRHSTMRLPGGNEASANLVDLLSHRLGLFGHAQDSKLEDGEDPRYLRAGLATLHNICAPGACHAYQNVAYDAASEIVERVTGRPYGQVLHERLFAPLGMSSASTSREALIRSPSWARPHVGAAPLGPEEVNDIYYRVPAAGGVNGSIKDLAIWMLAQMGLATDVLPAAVLENVQTPLVRTPGENFRRRKYRERTPVSAYGLGWRVFTYAGHRVIGHHGGVRGYRSTILFDPRLRSGVVVLWNSASPMPNGIEYEVMDMIYRLDRRDWLELDAPLAPAPGEPQSNAHESEGGGA
jgi:beta-lactamase class C